MSKNYIPANMSDFDDFQSQLNAAVTLNAVAWNIPASEATELDTRSTAFGTLYLTVKNRNQRTREQLIAFNENRTDFEAWLRPFCQSFVVNNLLIPLQTRVALGFNPRGFNPPSSRPAIDTPPLPRMEPLGGGKVRFIFKVAADSGRASRHPDSDGVTLYVQMVAPGGTPLPGEEHYDKVFSTRASFTRQFELDKVGSTIYLYSRWVNTSDSTKDSNYSPTISLVIS